MKTKTKLSKYFIWIVLFLIILICLALVKISLTGRYGGIDTEGDSEEDENEGSGPIVREDNPQRIWHPSRAASENGCRPDQEGEVAREACGDSCYKCKKNSKNEFSFVEIDSSDSRCKGPCVDWDYNDISIPSSAFEPYGDEVKDSCPLIGGSIILEAICGPEGPSYNSANCLAGTSCLLDSAGNAFCGTEEQKAKCGEACPESIMCQGYPNSICFNGKCEVLCSSTNNLKVDSTGCKCIDICDDENPCTVHRVVRGSDGTEHCDNSNFLDDGTITANSEGKLCTCEIGRCIGPQTQNCGDACITDTDCKSEQGKEIKCVTDYTNPAIKTCKLTNCLTPGELQMGLCDCSSTCDDNNECTKDSKTPDNKYCTNVNSYGSCTLKEPIMGTTQGICRTGECRANEDICEGDCLDEILENNKEIIDLINCARSKKSSAANPCLGEIGIEECPDTGFLSQQLGGYNPITSNIQICEGPHAYSYSLLSKILEHEITHAIERCGYFFSAPPIQNKPLLQTGNPNLDSCLNQLTHEMIAYYCSGECKTKGDCIIFAFGSRNSWPNLGKREGDIKCFGDDGMISEDSFSMFSLQQTYIDEWWSLNGPDSTNPVCNQIKDYCEISQS